MSTNQSVAQLRDEIGAILARLDSLAESGNHTRPTVAKSHDSGKVREDLGNGWIATSREAGPYADKSGKVRQGRAVVQVRNAETNETIKVYAPTLDEASRIVFRAIGKTGRTRSKRSR